MSETPARKVHHALLPTNPLAHVQQASHTHPPEYTSGHRAFLSVYYFITGSTAATRSPSLLVTCAHFLFGFLLPKIYQATQSNALSFSNEEAADEFMKKINRTWSTGLKLHVFREMAKSEGMTVSIIYEQSNKCRDTGRS